jgi:hypothetical protein
MQQYWADLTVKVLANTTEEAEELLERAGLAMEKELPGVLVLKGFEMEDGLVIP